MVRYRGGTDTNDRSPGVYECWTEVEGPTTILCVRGELDVAAWAEFPRQVNQLAGDASWAGVDLGEVTYIDMHAVRELERLAAAMRIHGGRLVIINPSAIVRRVFEILELDREWPIVTSRRGRSHSSPGTAALTRPDSPRPPLPAEHSGKVRGGGKCSMFDERGSPTMVTGPVGYFALVLHTHLPFVLGHGRWPHGSDWLSEVTAGCYLPLLDTFAELAAAGHPPRVTIDVSPVLAEQFAAPVFKKEIEEFLRARIASARDNAADFERQGRGELVAGAAWWEGFYRARLAQFERLGGDLIGEFRRLHDTGAIHLVTCAATHGYLPLLLRDESIDLQLRVAAAAHRRHFGHAPSGVWLPECAYRPRYEWTPPIGQMRGRVRARRAGIEEFLARAGLRFFFTDVHLMRGGSPLAAYRDFYPALRALGETAGPSLERNRTPYRPYEVASRGGTGSAVAFVRDPETTMQVWSRDAGYPGDGAYLEFHKKHWPGGLRYWRVTSPRSDLGDKQMYVPEEAAARTRSHADHFVSLLRGVLGEFRERAGRPGIASSPYDTELFGHWWFEGPQWIGEVYRRLPGSSVDPIDCAAFLDRAEPAGPISLQEGSWGEGGDHRVWLNRDTEWTWERIYPVEDEFWSAVREAADDRRAEVRRILAQAARELLLLQASDWQFLITTWAARDYAESRFSEHYANVTRLLQMLRRAAGGGAPDRADDEFLTARETQNFLFPDIEAHLPAAAGARG